MADEAKPSSPSSSKLGKLFGPVFFGINLAILGGVVFYIYTQTLGFEPKSLSEQQALHELEEFHKELDTKPAVYTMDTLTTNLDGIPRRLVRLQISLEMLDQNGFEEAVELGAAARDSLMHLLNSKTYDELETVQGKLQLKNQILAQLNGYMKRGVVRQVYFNDFVIQ